MSIKCGNCKEYHESTQEVRSCYQHRMTSETIASYAPMGPVTPVQEELPLPKSPATPAAAAADWEQVIRDINLEIANDRYYHCIGRHATPKQIDYVNSLMARRVHGLDEEVAEGQMQVWLRSLPMKAISILINELKNAPLKGDVRPSPGHDKHQDLPEVPEGRYAVTGTDGTTKFYKVDRPTEGRWAGYTFVKIQAGDDFHRVPAQRAILKQIAEAGTKEAMLRYGRELGHCGHCGRTLTNDESRELGIGPVCREKMGF